MNEIETKKIKCHVCPACGIEFTDTHWQEVNDNTFTEIATCPDCLHTIANRYVLMSQIDTETGTIYQTDAYLATPVKVVVEVYGGVADVPSPPDGVEIEIQDHDDERR